jgi:hypothetical protein
MTSITLSVTESFKQQLKQFLWVNWSEIAREETMKKLILENYMKTGTITDEEWEFCEKIDWHPVDELPLKEDFIKKLEAIKKEKSIRVKSVSEIFKNCK